MRQVVLLCDKCKAPNAQEVLITVDGAVTRTDLCAEHMSLPITEAIRLGVTNVGGQKGRGRPRISFTRLMEGRDE